MAATCAVKATKMRSISCASCARYCRMRAFASTTACGSTNTVAPVEDTSWMIPLTSPRYSLLTGTTYRPLRMETTLSCRYLEVSILRTMLSSRSRMLFSVARIFLRSSASVREAVSAMASGARMALEICCSRPGSGASA